MKKTKKISEIIEILKEFKERLGDLPVYLQEDAEGNGFGTLEGIDQSFTWSDREDKKALFINPWEEHLEYDELWEEK